MRSTPSSVFRSIPLILFAGFLALPVLAVLASWLPFSPTGQGDAQAGAILREMASTVLPGYVATPMTEHNPYPMPFLLTADEVARRIARVIDAGRGYAVVPWQMAIVAKLLRLLPNRVFDAALAGRGRKPRGTGL